MNRRTFRRLKSNAMVGLMIVAVMLAVLPLLFILADLVIRAPAASTWRSSPRHRPPREKAAEVWSTPSSAR